MIRQLDLRLLRPGLAGFWSLYFAIVTLSNLTDCPARAPILPAGWRWVSGNPSFIAASTGKFGVPAWMSSVLLAPPPG
jgi:hypothetical protein